MPVLDFENETFMPGGAANVARNLTALQVPTDLLGTVGRDPAARQLQAGHRGTQLMDHGETIEIAMVGDLTDSKTSSAAACWMSLLVVLYLFIDSPAQPPRG